MNLLLKVFAEIAFFRRGPEDLPASTFLLSFSLLLYSAGTIATSAVFAEDGRQVFLEALADITMMLLWYGSLLVIYNRGARLQQTLTALFGTGALLYLVAYPVMSWLQHPLDAGTGAQLPAMLMMAILIWSIAVAGHIVHRALDIQFSLGIAICICYFFSSVAVFSFLFGANT